MDNIDSMDEIITMGSKDHHHPSMIMKGKRTKRPRQPSPTSTVFTASSCSSGGDGGGGGGGGGNNKLLSKIQSSDSLCSEILSTSREEDEDMANCLILLARSGKQNTMMSTTIQINNNIEKQGGDNIKSEKIDRKKFKEATTTTSTIRGKDGTYVYECKTCNRSFTSFQALGGHRTSHKKHKPTVEIEDKKVKILPPLFDDDDDRHEQKKQYEEQEKGMKFLKISPSSLLSLELGNKKSHGNVVMNNKVKIHECSICGAEFSSGQALGGHMRRHRNTTSITTTPTDPSHDDVGERPRNMLELDLNLPAAPEDDDLHDSQFQFSLFSSPSLVNCQY